MVGFRDILLISLLIGIALNCRAQQSTYETRIEEAKGYALCSCIAYMNQSVDSLSAINKDYSGSYFVQLSHLTLDEMVKIRDFVNQECMKFWGTPQDPEGNMIGFSTWKFYSSPELDHFIRQTIKQKSNAM